PCSSQRAPSHSECTMLTARETHKRVLPSCRNPWALSKHFARNHWQIKRGCTTGCYEGATRILTFYQCRVTSCLSCSVLASTDLRLMALRDHNRFIVVKLGPLVQPIDPDF